MDCLRAIALLFLLPAAAFAAVPPAVSNLSLSSQNTTYQTWVQTAMREGDTNLYAFSCDIGYTNWSFVTGGTNNMIPIYGDPIGHWLRDPSHFYYNGQYYLAYNTDANLIGVAVSADDRHWTCVGYATIGPGPHWSPKFFLDATNALWLNVRYSDAPGGIYPWQQYCFRFDTSNPTNTVGQDGRYVCTNIWHKDQSDFPTAAIIWNNGLFYLYNQGGNSYCSPTLSCGNWTQIGTNLWGNTMDGPCIAKYEGTWYITDSQNGSDNWFCSSDLTNWTLSTTAGWKAQFGFEEGTAVIDNSTISTATLAWNPNYTTNGQETVVVASDDLTVPRNQWQTLFMGATNRYTFTNDRPARFFSAYNVSTNGP